MPDDVTDLSLPRVYDVDVDEVLRYELEHADEIAAEANKAFDPSRMSTPRSSLLPSMASFTRSPTFIRAIFCRIDSRT